MQIIWKKLWELQAADTCKITWNFLVGNGKIVKNRRSHRLSWQSWNLDFAKPLQKSITSLGKVTFHFNYLNCAFTWNGSKLELLNVPESKNDPFRIFFGIFSRGKPPTFWKWFSSELSADTHVRRLDCSFLRCLDFVFMVSWILKILIILNYLYSPWQFYADILYLFRFGVNDRGYLSIYP